MTEMTSRRMWRYLRCVEDPAPRFNSDNFELEREVTVARGRRYSNDAFIITASSIGRRNLATEMDVRSNGYQATDATVIERPTLASFSGLGSHWSKHSAPTPSRFRCGQRKTRHRKLGTVIAFPTL